MISVLICDDEKSIREGLTYILDWEKLGFDIAGEAGNGDEAYDKILELKPGLVLMDMRMPGMEGLEVIKRTKEAGFEGNFVIISGFSDFSYAKEAIRLGVDNYITKPVDEDELEAAVLKVKSEIEKAHQNKEVFDNYRSKARNTILQDILFNRNTDSISYRDLGLDASCYQVVIYENYSAKFESSPYSFAELMRVTNRDNDSYEILTVDSMDVIILKGSFSMDRFKDFVTHYDEKPLQKGSPLDNIFLAYGRSVDKPEDIHLSFEDVRALIPRRFFCLQGQHTLGYEEFPKYMNVSDPLSKAELTRFSKDLTGYLLSFNRTKTAETLYALEQYLFSVTSSQEEIKLFIADIYFQIKEKLNATYADLSIPFPANSEVITILDTKNYLYEMIRFLSEQFEIIMNATGTTTRDTLFEDILYYINHNYKTNIKLESIAPLFGYNSAYLGKIFSKNVGENFNSYVDHVRIEQSKKLLAENKLKVYEVAEAVGYRNVDYFHKKFKKYEGMSPAEYRRSQGGTDIG